MAISKDRRRELNYFCKQYEEKKRELQSISEIPSMGDGRSGSGAISDRTGNTAVKKIQLQKDLEDIEQSALEADGQYYPEIILHVTKKGGYNFRKLPMSERSFFRMIRKFYEILDEKRWNL